MSPTFAPPSTRPHHPQCRPRKVAEALLAISLCGFRTAWASHAVCPRPHRPPWSTRALRVQCRLERSHGPAAQPITLGQPDAVDTGGTPASARSLVMVGHGQTRSCPADVEPVITTQQRRRVMVPAEYSCGSAPPVCAPARILQIAYL
jgi:hypothetical protein